MQHKFEHRDVDFHEKHFEISLLKHFHAHGRLIKRVLGVLRDLCNCNEIDVIIVRQGAEVAELIRESRETKRNN